MTKHLTRIVYQYFFIEILFMFAIIFVFEPHVDNALQLIGYDDNFVSYFPFVKNLYLKIALDPNIGKIDPMYFHMLDIALWLSIVVWGTRLAIGIIYLKQFDDYYQKVSLLISERYYGVRGLALIGILGILVSPFIVTYVGMQPKWLNDPEIVMFITHFPRAYFFFYFMLYYFFGVFFAETVLFFIWTVFRQKWPGVVLWGDQPEKQLSRNISR